MFEKVKAYGIDLFKEVVRVYWGLLKIMLPVSIGVRIIQQTNLISWLGELIAPLTAQLGLPAVSGVVWINTIITNIYGGMITFHSFALGDSLTVAQASVLCQLMLVAHTFPVELTVARKAGIPLTTMFLWRFGLAIFSAWLLYVILNTFHLLQEPVQLSSTFEFPGSVNDTWIMWFQNEVHRYVIVFFVVMALMSMMRFLKAIGVIEMMTFWFRPIMNGLGIHASVIPITVVGMTLGILYGGALMIEETRKNNLAPRDVFYAFCLMGLCHSIIEDSLLMMSLGANGMAVFLYRPAIALLVLFVTIKLLKYIPTKWVDKITQV